MTCSSAAHMRPWVPKTVDSLQQNRRAADALQRIKASQQSPVSPASTAAHQRSYSRLSPTDAAALQNTMFFKLAVTFLFAAVAALQVSAEQHTVSFTNKYALALPIDNALLTDVPI